MSLRYKTHSMTVVSIARQESNLEGYIKGIFALESKVHTVTGIALIEGGAYEERIDNFAVSSKD